METLRLILLFVHILGFAALLGGLLTQLRAPEKRVNALMRDGAGTAVLAGLGLVGVIEAGDGAIDHAKIAVKLVIGVVILGLVMANLRKPLDLRRAVLRDPRPDRRQHRGRGVLGVRAPLLGGGHAAGAQPR